MVDYESEYRSCNKCDYLKYFARVIERLYNETGEFAGIRLIIIYTADVKRGSTDPVLDIGGLRMEIEEAFLSDFDPCAIWNELKEKLTSGINLTDEDMMRMIIYPLTFTGKEAKQKAVGRVIELAKEIPDEDRMYFVFKMIWVFADKFITENDSDKIKEALTMTKVDRLYAEEKRQAVEAAVADTTASVTETVTHDVTVTIARNFLKSGDSVEKVAENTGLSIDSVKELQMAL